MFRNSIRLSSMRLLCALLTLTLLLTACGTKSSPTATQPAAVEAQPTALQPKPAVADTYPAPGGAQTGVSDTYPAPGDSQPTTGDAYPAPGNGSGQTPSGTITLTLDGVAQSFTLEVKPAVSAAFDGPYWQLLPEHTLLTLAGYPVSPHTWQPQIVLYPVAELAALNQGAATIITDLQTLLGSKQAGESLPFLPLVNAAQMFHAQVAYLDFASGSGVRYVTQLAQGFVLVNNSELIYTFQGLTADGKYYVAAVLPVTLPSLPADGQLTTQDPDAFVANFQAYLAETAAALEGQPASAFTPDLSALDQMVQSIEVK